MHLQLRACSRLRRLGIEGDDRPAVTASTLIPEKGQTGAAPGSIPQSSPSSAECVVEQTPLLTF